MCLQKVHCIYIIFRLLSIGVLMEYLTHSSVSPLPSVFVEVVDPLASGVSSRSWLKSVSLLFMAVFYSLSYRIAVFIIFGSSCITVLYLVMPRIYKSVFSFLCLKITIGKYMNILYLALKL